MNAMGMMLLGSIAHATLFAIVGTFAYLAIRRWGPAAGSLAAGSSLAIMAMVSIAVLSPWPRWWTLGDAGRSPAAIRGARDSGATSTPSPGSTADDPATAARAVAKPPGDKPLSEVRPSLIELFLDEMRKPSDVTGAEPWGWCEWLAFGFFASFVMGAARLGIGLWGIARLRAASRPVEDREIDDLIAILRAEIGCRRGVEIREVDELATPATIGWRRPTLLLPSDWRDWDHDECRAVLAHELAHVRRGDFPVGVFAQAAVAMHFYHPLAHWLAARLRLEQELAADAWGAGLSGGPSSYLATLAQMALRRDGRALTWPARAFLPSHGTFVRRIEMLKNHGPVRNVTLPLSARALTIGVLAGIGLLVAGLRGPAGDSPALAQDRPVERPRAAPESRDLAFVPAEVRMVVVIRPAELLRRPETKPLLDALREGPVLRDGLPMPPEEIEQLIVFWESEAGAGRAPALSRPSGFIVRATRAQDWKALLNKIAAQHRDRVEDARHDGQAYVRLGAGGPGNWGAYTPDDRTLVATEEVTLRDLIADRNAPSPRHPWDEAWKKVAGGLVMAGVDTRWIRREFARVESRPQGRGATLTPETFSPLYEKARAYAMSVNASDRSFAIDLVAEVSSPENGKAVAETLQAILTLGRNAMAGALRDAPRPPGPAGEATAWLVQVGTTILERARVETTDGFVRLHAESPLDLAEGMRALGPFLTTFKAAKRRTQSVNNLKHICLAFHNYHSANGHFPASVNRDKGEFPYSWRVAILPYLEQQELYNQYHFDEPWDGSNNRKLIDKMPAIYSYPSFDGTPSSPSNPSYFLFTGDSTIGGAEGGARIDQILDGTSLTILAVEAKRDIPWTKPEDIPFDPKAPLPELGGYTPEGFNAAFGDGAVRYLRKSINPNVLKALITRNGFETISSDSY